MFTITSKALEIAFPLGKMAIDMNSLIALWFVETVIIAVDASLKAPLTKMVMKFWRNVFTKTSNIKCQTSKAISR